MGTAGVQEVIYTRYPEPGNPPGSNAALKACLDGTMPMMQTICEGSTSPVPLGGPASRVAMATSCRTASIRPSRAETTSATWSGPRRSRSASLSTMRICWFGRQDDHSDGRDRAAGSPGLRREQPTAPPEAFAMEGGWDYLGPSDGPHDLTIRAGPWSTLTATGRGHRTGPSGRTTTRSTISSHVRLGNGTYLPVGPEHQRGLRLQRLDADRSAGQRPGGLPAVAEPRVLHRRGGWRAHSGVQGVHKGAKLRSS